LLKKNLLRETDEVGLATCCNGFVKGRIRWRFNEDANKIPGSHMKWVGFGTLLAGLLTFVASLTQHVLACKHVTATPFVRIVATQRRAKSWPFPINSRHNPSPIITRERQSEG
jgi:hypothetical protein